jgi:hypothetical protein
MMVGDCRPNPDARLTCGRGSDPSNHCSASGRLSGGVSARKETGVIKGRRIRLAAIVVLGVGALVLGRFGPYESLGKSPTQGAAILSRLRSAADDGNAAAAKALADFGAYASAHGLTPASAADGGQQIRELAQANGLAVGAQGFAPFWLRIDGSRDFVDRADLERYRAVRLLVLDDLAVTAPNRLVAAQVSFTVRPAPADLLVLIAAYSAQVLEIHIDAVQGGARLLTYGSRDEAARGMSGRSPEEVVREIRSNLAGAGLEGCGSDPNTVALEVKFLRLELPAGQALRLASAPGILAVDPFTDAVDQFAARAVHVSIGAWPNLTEPWETFAGSSPAEQPCELTK